MGDKLIDQMDYKKYSLEQLSNWVHDALSAGEATPAEVYNTIKKVVEEQYYHHKHQTSQAYELLALLNGNGKGHIKEYDDCVDKILSCDKDDTSPQCKGAWNDFWEEHYYPDEHCMPPWGHSDLEYCIREAEYYNKTDKVNKWVLPVQVDDAAGDAEPIYYVNFPDDLLEAANLKEGDQLYWIDRKDGSFEMRKVTKPLGMDEC